MIYLGFDVLDFYEFNRKGPTAEQIRRKFVLLDPRTGRRTPDEVAPGPAPVRTFVWTCFSLAEVAELSTWLDERIGRAVPFWLPSWQRDLSLATDFVATDATAEIRWVRYAQQFFPNTAARRHVALWAPGLEFEVHGIVDADDPGNGLTETLNLTPAAGRTHPADSTIISFLKFCRLADDQVEIEYPARGVCEATIRVVEIPTEAPVPEEEDV